MMSMETKTYNGWTNYETWNVALWLDGDEGTYNYVHELADTARDDNTSFDYSQDDPPAELDRDGAIGDLSAALKNMIEEMTPDLGASMFADLLTAAISEVDWHEIAENILSES